MLQMNLHPTALNSADDLKKLVQKHVNKYDQSNLLSVQMSSSKGLEVEKENSSAGKDQKLSASPSKTKNRHYYRNLLKPPTLQETPTAPTDLHLIGNPTSINPRSSKDKKPQKKEEQNV